MIESAKKEKTQKTKLINVKIEKLHPFKDHPYKVVDDESMAELKNSISENGLLNRIIIRPHETAEEYEIIAGHRRVYAARQLGIKELPAVIYFVDRDAATVLMVDSNVQRETVSPMEKAKAYRMKTDALSHQGKTLGHNVPKSDDNRTTAKVGETAGESYKTVQRYIRLTHLIPELQEYVDNGQMKLLPAVEISYLDEEAQRDVVDRIIETESFPSHAQARKMKALFEEGTLDYDAVSEIMSELKPNQVEKLKIPMDDIRKYVPRDYTPKQITELAVKLFKQNFDRQHDRDAR
ncbi:MAG: ParB/RepB/Spo0J family partition protein [Clostridiales bacterium]|nr:ParB/RepB/Spo0J family partition protein [Candidatus Equinaster intestinalis]